MQNKQILEQVYDWLKAGAPHEQSHGMGFDMQYVMIDVENEEVPGGTPREWIDYMECGTVGCIAGAIVQFHRGRPCELDERYPTEAEAARIMGFHSGSADYDRAMELFYPEVSDGHFDNQLSWIYEEGENYYDSTPEQVARVLRKYIDTDGKVVDWTLAED